MPKKSFIRTIIYRRPSIGLVLSGGGAHGLAHIGVLRVLEREGVPINFLAGTSFGGLVAAGYAAGMHADDLEREARDATQMSNLLRMLDPGLPQGGLLRGQKVEEYFKHLFGEQTFADLQIPLAVVAVDLISHREVVIDSGQVATAIRATTAMPGVFRPVEMDGMRLTDGGVLNNLPVDVAKKMGAERVIAVDIGLNNQEGFGHWIGNHRWIPGSVSMTLEVIDDALYTVRIVGQEQKLQKFPPDVLIAPELPSNISAVVGYGRVGDLIAAGERAAEEHIEDIKMLLHGSRHFSIPNKARSARKGLPAYQFMNKTSFRTDRTLPSQKEP